MDSFNILDEIRSHSVLCGLGLLVCYLVGEALYNLHFHPLAKYPGPFLAKISSIPNFYYAMTGDRHIWMWQLHQVYGSPVRYRPNGILFNTPSAYRTIYNNKAPVKKGIMYEIWTPNRHWANTFTITDRTVHARKRRILNSIFSDKLVHSAATFVIRHVDRWNELSIDGDGETWSKPKNIADWSDYLVLDILGDLCFGASLNTKEPQENPLKEVPHANAEALQFFYPITQSPMIDLWIWLKPRGLDTVLGMITPPKVKQYLKFVEDSVQKRVELEEEIQKQGSAKVDGRKDIFHYILAAKDPETGEPALSREDLVGEANILVVAGSDSTAVVLAGFFFYMTRNPRILAKLTDEIRTTFKSVDEIVWSKKLSSCQYLRACIDETLRLCPAGPSDLDREILSDMEIDGCFVRTGTHVGCSHWTTSRNEDFYPDVNVFRPERFIVDEQTGVTAEDVARAHDSYFSFSLGPFNCVGKNLAMLELTVTIARTLYRMDVRALPGDTLGEGAPNLGWGRRHRNVFQYKDAFVAIRNGPIVQFRKRQN